MSSLLMLYFSRTTISLCSFITESLKTRTFATDGVVDANTLLEVFQVTVDLIDLLYGGDKERVVVVDFLSKRRDIHGTPVFGGTRHKRFCWLPCQLVLATGTHSLS